MENNINIVAHLKKIPLFKDLSLPDLEKMAAIATYKEAVSDEFLLLERQVGEDLLVLVSGKVVIEISLPSSNELEDLCSLQAGDVIGELSLLGIDRRSASAKVIEDATYLVFNKVALLETLSKDHSLGYRFMTRLAQILAHRIVGTTKNLGNALYQVNSTGKFAG